MLGQEEQSPFLIKERDQGQDDDRSTNGPTEIEPFTTRGDEFHLQLELNTTRRKCANLRQALQSICDVSWVAMAAIVSGTCNVVLLWLLFRAQHRDRSPYADLTRNVVRQFNTSSEYGLATADEGHRSVLWESLDASAGEIALPTAWATGKGLPSATTFWWDKSRSVYLVNGYHSLHCLRKLRRSIVLSHHNMTQLDPYPHLVHCMDHLLQNIICEADDTPMYTSPVPHAQTGQGQQRTCRSWSQLENWVKSHSSCFAYINETQGVDVELKRFRYCPTDSPAGRLADANMRAHFGLVGEEWSGRKPEDIDSMPRYWEGFLPDP